MKKTLLILSILLFPIVSSAMPVFPMAFWGNVTIDGNPSPIGTIVKAYYGDTLAGQVVTVEEGIYGYIGSTQQKLVVGEGVGEIIFKIQSNSINDGEETGGLTKQSYSGFEKEKTSMLDLSFKLTEVSPPSDPPPAGGGGGGGGGGGSYIPTTPVTKVGDSNGDGKIDKYDFSLMMSNWGKTGSNNSDLNNDGKVDKYDFALLMSNWGK